MNKIPNTIHQKLMFLKFNEFILPENITDIYVYDDKLTLPTYDDIKKLEDNLSKYIMNYNSSTTYNLIEYFNDHHFFIQTFPNEKKFYNLHGFDSWINHFINNIYYKADTSYKNELDASFKYPLIIGFELNQNIKITPLHIEIMRQKKDLIKKYIYKKKYKWFTNNEQIKEMIESLENSSSLELENNFKITKCLCDTDLIKYLSNCEKDSYTNYYSDDKLDDIHRKYCNIHNSYLQKNQIEYDKFIKYNSDKWITFLTNQGISFQKLHKTNPEDMNLYLFDLINLVED
jgi:hypothetical protein